MNQEELDQVELEDLVRQVQLDVLVQQVVAQYIDDCEASSGSKASGSTSSSGWPLKVLINDGVGSLLEFGGLGWGSQNVEAPNLKLPTKWCLNVFFDEKHLKTIV